MSEANGITFAERTGFPDRSRYVHRPDGKNRSVCSDKRLSQQMADQAVIIAIMRR